MFTGTLLDFQKVGSDFLFTHRSGLLFDECGLGKTIQSIHAAIKLKDVLNVKKCLVVCPNSLKYSWAEEIEKFCNEKAIVISGSKKERAEKLRTDSFFYIINYELILRDFGEVSKTRWDVVVCDEIHRIKSCSARTSQLIKTIPRSYSWGLSGTPLFNDINDIYSITQFVNPFLFYNYWAFKSKYMVLEKRTAGHHTWREIVGYKNLDELKAKLNSYYIRRTKEEVLEELPEKTIENIYIELSEDQKADYAEVVNKIKSKIIRDENFIDLVTELRKICDCHNKRSAKLEELKELVKELLTGERKIVIFTNWVTTLHQIAALLNSISVKHVTIYGDVSTEDRAENVKKFTEDSETKVIICTSAGENGLNLQRADVLINFTLPFTWASCVQRNDRVHRIGQKNNVTIYNFIARNTIEEKVFTSIQTKKDLFDSIIQQNNEFYKELLFE